MANPPFNVNGVDKEKLKDDKRFTYGLPKPDNANYIWIQIFLSALNDKGRAGFVMANSSSDARQSELEIRQKMLEDNHIVRLYRGEDIETDAGSEKLMKEHFPKGKYRDIDGLCKVATLKEITGHGYSLNPGRYVGAAEKEEEDGDFYERLEELNEELERLNTEARDLEERIADNVEKLMEGQDDV